MIVSIFRFFSPKHHIQNHHHRKADHRPSRGKLSVPAPLTLGDQLLDHHEDHRPRGKAEGAGEEGLSLGSPPPPR